MEAYSRTCRQFTANLTTFSLLYNYWYNVPTYFQQEKCDHSLYVFIFVQKHHTSQLYQFSNMIKNIKIFYYQLICRQ